MKSEKLNWNLGFPARRKSIEIKIDNFSILFPIIVAANMNLLGFLYCLPNDGPDQTDQFSEGGEFRNMLIGRWDNVRNSVCTMGVHSGHMSILS